MGVPMVRWFRRTIGFWSRVRDTNLEGLEVRGLSFRNRAFFGRDCGGVVFLLILAMSMHKDRFRNELQHWPVQDDLIVEHPHLQGQFLHKRTYNQFPCQKGGEEPFFWEPYCFAM